MCGLCVLYVWVVCVYVHTHTEYLLSLSCLLDRSFIFRSLLCVYIRGANSVKQLLILIDSIDTLIRDWLRIKVPVYVPCIHCLERNEDPYLFPLKVCESAMAKGKPVVICEVVGCALWICASWICIYVCVCVCGMLLLLLLFLRWISLTFSFGLLPCYFLLYLFSFPLGSQPGGDQLAVS
jgi:hypothetical protein